MDGRAIKKADGGISYSGDFSTPDYYQVYNALPNAGLAGQLVQRMFPNPSTTGAYTAYMNQLASSALPPPAPNPTPFVTNVPNVSGPPIPLMPTSNFNFSQFGLGSNAAPALNALAAQQSALALPKMVQPESKAHGGEVDAALHAVRHHLAGGGFLSDLFSGPDYLSTGEAASPTNWGDPELASDFFKADKALRLAREVQGNADDVTGSIPARAPLTAPRPGKVEERELPAPPVNIPFAAPERGVSMLSSDISPESVTSLPLAYAPTPVAAPAAAAIDQATGKLTARIPDEPSGTALTKQQADYITRTIAAETSGKTPEETQAIASVILNRINSGKYGSSPEAVLFAKRQFEPWMNPAGANYPMKISPTSQRYLDARAALEAALAGEDITGGATHFWGPKAQEALGRNPPSWSYKAPGVDIGETRFHKLERAEGGDVKIDRSNTTTDMSVVDKALAFLGNFNPVGSAEAASLPKIFAKAGEYGPIQNVKIGKSTGIFRETPEHFEISSIRTPVAHRGQGGAHAVMQDILQMADEVGKPARLIASPLDKKTNQNKLIEFYKKYGFDLTGEKANSFGDPWMERPMQIKERAHGGSVDDALRVVREHHADGEAVGKAPVATDNSERVRAAEDAAKLAKQIQAYEASMANIRQQPQDIQSMTHAPEKPRAPISIEALGKNREFGSAPYDVAAPLSSLAQGAYDLKTMPLYAAGTVFPPAAALGTALDTAEGVASGSPTQVAMGALGGPLKVARNVIAPLAVATGVTAPDEAEAAKLLKLIRAYHGSPYKFDRFDMSKIGTGEGNQAYGHGLYFAGDENIARHYRDVLTQRDPTGYANAHYNAQQQVARFGNDPERAAEIFRDQLNAIGPNDPNFEKFRSTLEMIESGKYKEPFAQTGHMYEVNIHADPERLLNWDKPLREQSPDVRDILASHLASKSEEMANRSGFLNFKSNPQNFMDVGGHTFRPMNSAMSSDLESLGIPGIKYLDAGSRGITGEPTHNYVIFNDKLIDINRRYAQGGDVEPASVEDRALMLVSRQA